MWKCAVWTGVRLQGETERLQVPNLSSSQQRPAARQSPAGRAERAAAVCRLLACCPFGFSALTFGFARQLATTAFAAARSSAGQHSLVFAGGARGREVQQHVGVSEHSAQAPALRPPA